MHDDRYSVIHFTCILLCMSMLGIFTQYAQRDDMNVNLTEQHNVNSRHIDTNKIWPAFSVTFSMNGRPAQGRVEVGQTFFHFIMTEVSVVYFYSDFFGFVFAQVCCVNCGSTHRQLRVKSTKVGLKSRYFMSRMTKENRRHINWLFL